MLLATTILISPVTVSSTVTFVTSLGSSKPSAIVPPITASISKSSLVVIYTPFTNSVSFATRFSAAQFSSVAAPLQTCEYNPTIATASSPSITNFEPSITAKSPHVFFIGATVVAASPPLELIVNVLVIITSALSGLLVVLLSIAVTIASSVIILPSAKLIPDNPLLVTFTSVFPFKMNFPFNPVNALSFASIVLFMAVIAPVVPFIPFKVLLFTFNVELVIVIVNPRVLSIPRVLLSLTFNVAPFKVTLLFPLVLKAAYTFSVALIIFNVASSSKIILPSVKYTTAELTSVLEVVLVISLLPSIVNVTPFLTVKTALSVMRSAPYVASADIS